MRTRMGLGLLLLWTALSCAKDKTQDDYNREKVRSDLALYQSVAGRYSGLMYSTIGNKVVGALQLNLTARIQTAATPGNSANQGAPILVSELDFQDNRRLSLAATSGYYDPDSGLYQTDIVVTRSDGKLEQVSINASLRDGQLTGTIQALKYKNSGSSFSLVRDGDSLDKLAVDANLNANSPGEDILQLSAFTGKTVFNSGVSKFVRLVVLQPRVSSEEDFVNLLVPVRTVQVSMNYDTSAHILSNSAQWDLRTGSLTAATILNRNNQNVTLSLDCVSKNLNSGGGTIACTHYTTQLGIVARTSGKLETSPSADPIDNSNTDASVTRVYAGSTRLTGDVANRAIQMTVVYPARSRIDDILNLFLPDSQETLQITIRYSRDLTMSFNMAQYDKQTGRVDAINAPSSSSPINNPGAPGAPTAPGTPAPPTTPGGPSTPGTGNPLWTPELHCTGFYFENTRRPFTCIYSSNRSEKATLQFRP